MWIDGAPVIDHNDPEDVLSWIQERTTCHIPDKESNPKLHRLVTRYQMHKCSAYCKRKRKVGSVYLTNCRFGFPRKVSACAKLNQVSECLKLKKRIYQSELEVRVNDYNPLLLLLWKANIDIQFFAEVSVALAHYVSGYIIKAERSNIQDIWQEVSERTRVSTRYCGPLVSALCIAGSVGCTKLVTYCMVIT